MADVEERSAVADEGGRSARKRRAIMDAATTLFLRNGYLGTSVDEIAAAAAVSKQTVYKHFEDKERLFTEIVLATIDQVGEPFFAGIDTLEETKDLEVDLRELARQLIAIVKDQRLLQLRRLVIGEAERFPELGRAYFERGPGRTADMMSSRFRHLAERGLLRVEDPWLAAQEFVWLVLSIPMNRAMLSGDAQFTDEELEGYAQEAARVFYAAYGSASLARRKGPGKSEPARKSDRT
jgi:TetR/AcrR family transcriptional regulator, mexJK operon transcriptional repressor